MGKSHDGKGGVRCGALVALLAVATATGAAAGIEGQMVRAAGMPLSDGSLPPGTLTVRLVRGAFESDLCGIPVDLEVDGRVRQGTTGDKGRVEFARLPVGARVRASALVGSERLESDVFPVPGESGVRLLLVAASSGVVSIDTARQAAPATGTTPSPVDRVGAGVALGLAGATACGFLMTLVRRQRPRPSQGA